MAVYTQEAVSGQPVRNDSMTVLAGGTVSNSRANQVNLGNIAYQSGTAPALASVDIQKAESNRDFGGMIAGRYVMQNINMAYIGNVASTALARAGSESRRAIHYRTTIRTQRQNLAGWNYVTGEYLTTPTVAVDDFTADHAATPSKSVPGELTLLYGTANPVNFDYVAKVVG